MFWFRVSRPRRLVRDVDQAMLTQLYASIALLEAAKASEILLRVSKTSEFLLRASNAL